MDVKLNKHNRNLVRIDTVKTTKGDTYEIGEYIGAGGNAVVHECIDVNGDVFAIKFLRVSSIKIRKRFEQEISVLKTLKHPHWIRYIDDGNIDVKFEGQDVQNIRYVIMERADGNLVDYLKSVKSSVQYEVYAPQFRGLSEALAELHEIAVHRDIKPENILFKGEKWLLSDLGLCSLCDADYVEITSSNEKIGPKFWLSPEAVNRIYFSENDILAASDVYQLCAVFWFVVTKRHPCGILMQEDWGNNDNLIFDIIVRSLAHNYRLRPQSGRELYELFCDATIN